MSSRLPHTSASEPSASTPMISILPQKPIVKGTNFFFSSWFPIDLLARIFVDFLTIVEAARVDSSLCCHDHDVGEGAGGTVTSNDGPRSRYLSLLRTVVFQLDQRSASDGVSAGCWRWLSRREICVGKLVVVDMFAQELKLDGELAAYPVRCDTIKTLHLQKTATFENKVAVSIVAQCTELLELRVFVWYDVSGTSVVAQLLLVAAPSVEILMIESLNARANRDEIIKIAAVRFPRLRCLDIHDVRGLSSAGLLQVAQSFENMTTLKLRGGLSQRAPLLEVIGKHGKRLEELSLLDNTLVEDGIVAAIADHCSVLHSLSLDITRVSNVGLHTLAMSMGHRLRILHLDSCKEGCKLTDTSVSKLFECFSPSHLAHLDLRRIRLITEAPFVRFSRNLSSLTKLSLWNMPTITDNSLVSIAVHCSLLTDIVLEDMNKINDRGFIELIKASPKLDTISLLNCEHVSDASVWVLASHCRKITSVLFFECPHINSPSAIELLVRNSQIRHMDNVRITPCGAAFFTSMEKSLCDSLEAIIRAKQGY